MATLRFLDADLHSRDTRTRMPFRFGIAVMTAAPHVVLRCRYEIDGAAHTGVAAEGLLPRWFDKSKDVTPEQELADLHLVIRQALHFAADTRGGTAFALWHELYQRQIAWAQTLGIPPLLAHFGVSLVERTLIDALARARRQPFATLLQGDALGIDLATIHPELTGHQPHEFLPTRPLASVVARHTVGLSDPLTAADLAPDERLDDGLPQTLEDNIRFYGLRHFKLKLRGDADADLARLQRIAALITTACGDDVAFTLDGNEQYHRVEEFRRFWSSLQDDASLHRFLQHMVFIEQPLHRSVALDPNVADLAGWRDAPPMIIDESDALIGDLPQALRLGYRGTSHKNCKGIIKGVAHRCLLTKRDAAGGARHHMSGEDLVNIGPVALMQDLAVQAALGNASVERNGHHYFRGLTMFEAPVTEAVLAAHGDLYTPFAGSARLDVRDGRLRLGSINASALGAAIPPLDGCEPVALDAPLPEHRARSNRNVSRAGKSTKAEG